MVPMETLKETTEYNCGYRVPLHTYLLKAGKMVGYIKEGTTEVIEFTKPLFFSKKNRKFVKVS